MSFNGGFPINQSVQWNERVILYTEQLMFSLPRAQRLKRNKVGPSSLAPKCGDVGCNHSTCLNHQKLQKKNSKNSRVGNHQRWELTQAPGEISKTGPYQQFNTSESDRYRLPYLSIVIGR